MATCLITQLKATVTDDNLARLGEIILHSNAKSTTSSDNRKIILGNLGGDVVLRIKGGQFRNSTNTEDIGDVLTRTNDATVYVPDGPCTIYASCKYRYGALNLGTAVYYDINQVRYNTFTNGSSIVINSASTTGDITSVNTMFSARSNNDINYNVSNTNVYGDVAGVDFTHIRNFRANYCANVTGDIGQVTLYSPAEIFQVQGTGVSGDLMHLLENTYAKKSSGTITVSIASTDATFRGVKDQGVLECTFSDGSIVVTRDGNIRGTYDGETWT